MQIDANGWRFDADAAGDPSSPLVLLLHGFPQTSHTWREQLPALAEAGRFAVAPNQRGYSPGARPEAQDAYATPELIADALAIADALGHPSFHLVGHDWGGQLAWLIAGSCPQRIHTLTVLSRPHPSAFAAALSADAEQSHRSRHHRAFQDAAAADRLLEDDARRLRRVLGEQGVPEDAVAAYLSRIGNREALDAALCWYRAASLARARARNVTVPTLYIWGDADATVGRSAALRTAEYVDAPYRFEVLENVGHFVTDQAPARVTELLLEHVGRNTRRSGQAVIA